MFHWPFAGAKKTRHDLFFDAAFRMFVVDVLGNLMNSFPQIFVELQKNTLRLGCHQPDFHGIKRFWIGHGSHSYVMLFFSRTMELVIAQ